MIDTQQKSLKANDNQKNLKLIVTSSKFQEHTMYGVSRCKNKRCGVYNIIIEEKSNTFKNPKIILPSWLGL